MEDIKSQIEAAWADRSLLKNADTQAAIRSLVEALDKGKVRVAEPTTEGWQVNDWVKKGVILYFPIQQMETIEVGIFEFHDKIALKRDFAAQGVRVVPPAVARQSRVSKQFYREIQKYRLRLSPFVESESTKSRLF